LWVAAEMRAESCRWWKSSASTKLGTAIRALDYTWYPMVRI